MKELCPVCDGLGHHFMIVKEGQLKIDREVTCKCWACKGDGYVEYGERGVDPTESTIIGPLDH